MCYDFKGLSAWLPDVEPLTRLEELLKDPEPYFTVINRTGYNLLDLAQEDIIPSGITIEEE